MIGISSEVPIPNSGTCTCTYGYKKYSRVVADTSSNTSDMSQAPAPNISYKELQKEAKRRGIPANMKVSGLSTFVSRM